MKRLIISAGLSGLVFAGTAAAKDSKDDWISIASTDTHTYSVRTSTFDISTNKQNEVIAIILGQATNLKKKQIEYHKWYVTGSDCEQGLGKLVHLGVDGTYLFETDYVHEGNNVSSAIGTVLCDVYLNIKKRDDKKGV